MIELIQFFGASRAAPHCKKRSSSAAEDLRSKAELMMKQLMGIEPSVPQPGRLNVDGRVSAIRKTVLWRTRAYAAFSTIGDAKIRLSPISRLREVRQRLNSVNKIQESRTRNQKISEKQISSPYRYLNISGE